MLDLQWHPDHRNQIHVLRSREHGVQGVARAIQQSLLMKQVLARIG
jgi:hypothetical protein